MAVKALQGWGGGGRVWEVGGGGWVCDRVKLSLAPQGKISDNEVFAVLLLVWLRHTIREEEMKSDVLNSDIIEVIIYNKAMETHLSECVCVCV